jgi:hypothetical protein
MNYKSDNGDSSKKSLEREFAERVELLGYSEAYEELIALITTAQRTELMGDPNAILTFMSGIAAQSLVKGEIYKLLQTISGKTVEQISELLTKEIKRFNIQRTINALISAEEKLRKAEIDPKIINLDKVFLPILQAISIEDNPVIQEMYENLLTAAIAGEKVDVKDINNLKLLESDDVLILEAMYKMGYDSCRGDTIKYQSGINREHFESAVNGLILQGIVESTVIEQIDIAIETALSNITRDKGAAEYTASEKQMFYLDLEAISVALKQALEFMIEAQTTNKYDLIRFTNKGWEFMQKCKGIITKSVETEHNP